MSRLHLPHLNLRRIIILGFVACLAAMGASAGISYYNLQRIENKVLLVEMADDLFNLILEMRRYEKNYFLYGNGFRENLRHLRLASRKIEEIETGEKLQVDPQLELLRRDLSRYGEFMERIHSREATPEDSALVGELRATGQRLEETSLRIVRYERDLIMRINNHLRRIIFASVAGLCILGVGLIVFLNNRIIKPLRDIEATTQRIAQGDFEPIDVGRSDDEVGRIRQALKHMVQELERRQEQLVQNKKLSSIGTLASGIAHQLNNPLNNIATSCRILMEEHDPDPDLSAKMLDNIDRETIRARDIVRGLLEFSRKHEFSLTRENLRSVVEGVLRLVSSHIPQGVAVETYVPENLDLVVDRQQIQEMLLNLILNGFQALEGSEDPGLAVYAQPDRLRGTVAVTVEDTGQGIPDEARSQVFDPFFTTKAVGSGTGLGLYIVYGIVRKHNGIICLESAEGVGTRFTISIPLDLSVGEEARS